MVVNIIPRMAYPNIKSHVGWYLDRIDEIELIERKGNCIPVSICLDKRKIGIRYGGCSMKQNSSVATVSMA